VFVVLNGPVIHEQDLSGELYGSSLSLDAPNRDSLPQFLPRPETQVFSAYFRKSRFLTTLLQYPSVSGLLGPSGYRLAQALVAEKSPLVQVQVFRYGQTQEANSSRSDLEWRVRQPATFEK
jgi:hypothetical protein